MTPPRLFRSACLFLALSALSVRASDWPLPATTPAAAGVSAPRLEALHASLDRFVDRGAYAGYVVLLARDGKIVDWHAHGWQDTAARTPLEKDSIVRIYSMTKIVTSAAILILLEDGRLKLTDPVELYLPALKNRQVLIGGTADAPELVPATHPITILELLTHTAGYYYDESWSADSPVAVALMKRARMWEAKNLDEFVQRVAAVPLHQQPGTKYRYGIHTDLLGAIVEKVSGQRLGDFFQEKIFGPLGMRDTAFSVPAAKLARLAQVHRRDGPGKLVLAGPAPDRGSTPDALQSGGGGLYSTAADYVRFAQMLLNGGELDGTRVLGRKTVELMTTDHLSLLADPHPFNKPEQGFGLGVRITTDLRVSPTLNSLGTYGWDGAMTTNVQIDPRERTVAILLTQHAPFNEDDIFATFTNGYYSALAK